MKVDTYFPNTGEKLFTFAISPIVVENHRVRLVRCFHIEVKRIGVVLNRNKDIRTPIFISYNRIRIVVIAGYETDNGY